jgi:hypothetical protein
VLDTIGMESFDSEEQHRSLFFVTHHSALRTVWVQGKTLRLFGWEEKQQFR